MRGNVSSRAWGRLCLEQVEAIASNSNLEGTRRICRVSARETPDKFKANSQGTLKTRYFLVYLACMRVKPGFRLSCLRLSCFRLSCLHGGRSPGGTSFLSFLGVSFPFSWWLALSFFEASGHERSTRGQTPRGVLRTGRSRLVSCRRSCEYRRFCPSWRARMSAKIGTFSGKHLVYREKWCIL